jgi:hypothetical protein
MHMLLYIPPLREASPETFWYTLVSEPGFPQGVAFHTYNSYVTFTLPKI